MCHLVTRFWRDLHMKKWLKTVLFRVQNPLISKFLLKLRFSMIYLRLFSFTTMINFCL